MLTSEKSKFRVDKIGQIPRVGEYIQQTVLRSFKSFGDVFELQELIGKFFGVLENVTDLMYVLEDLSNVDKFHVQCIQSSDNDEIELNNSTICDYISFKNVDIVAPGGTCCAKSLNFTVSAGKPLIVTGPNGSGKSSLFRVLGGMWNIPKGIIERPCNNEGIVTHQNVFLVSQKPYSVTGTLLDQITYPKQLKKKLEKLLHLVGIFYLVDRFAVTENIGNISGWDAVAIWEDVLNFVPNNFFFFLKYFSKIHVLSLGEQQRLGVARLFFHAPQFAVLDECTSAVSVDVEENLYRAAHDRGITSITISQRLALEQFHHQELKMGDDNGILGWEIRNLH
eukprot:GSMAST32.ASY1.ANO1.1758.1 assembled CDS